jgi:hypothetical protein
MASSLGSPSLLRHPGVLAGLAGLFLAGCAPADPLDSKVDGSDPLAFALWQSKMTSRLTPAQVETMNKALQEMKFHIMSAEHVSGGEFVQSTLIEEVNGRTLREVERLGLTWELERAQAEWNVLDDSLIRNSLMTTRPGDHASVEYLSDLKARQVKRLHAAADEVALTKARLAATGQLAGP